MRRGIDSLAYIVKKSFHLDPFSVCVFLFCGSRKDRLQGTLLGRLGLLAAL
ncbi:IS66 family insertion sequence element accessory protein TnpB [Lactobacillus delbrueckii subsp. bulgaricus]